MMKPTSPTLHSTIVFTIIVFVLIVTMAFIFPIEVVAKGTGRVVPVSRVQVVQPEYSGRISDIHIQNGSSVNLGEVLIELDATEAHAQLGTIYVENVQLHIEKARIDAMVNVLGEDIAERDYRAEALKAFILPSRLHKQSFAREQKLLLLAEIDSMMASLAQIEAKREANYRSEDVTNANVKRINAALEIQEERLFASRKLLRQEATSRSSYLDVKQNYVQLEKERDVYFRELERKAAERTQLDSERRRVFTDRLNALHARRSQINSRQSILAKEQHAAERRVAAATLTAPVSGVVDQLRVFTIGGVADAGAELLRIVPTNTQVEIEGVFSNQDIGFLAQGQTANIRLDAYPSERFGYVRGAVTDIAADSTEDAKGQWGYVVRIAPEEPFIRAGSGVFSLRPGMTATVDVTTDSRLIISYFFAPIVRTIQDAMGER